MKKTLLIIFVLSATTAAAQKVEVKEKYVAFNDRQGAAWSTIVYDHDEKSALKMARDFFKDTKGKSSYGKNELFIDDALIPEISSNPVDVYIQAVQKNSGEIELNVGYYTGTAFLSRTDKDPAGRAEQMVYSMSLSISKAGIENSISASAKELEKAERGQKDLVREKEQLEKTIAEAEKRITDSKKAIEENIKAQENQAKIITLQKEKFEKINAKLKAL